MLNIDEDGAQGTAGETSVAVEIVALIVLNHVSLV